MRFSLFAGLLLTSLLQGAALSADSTRGAQVFNDAGCIQCHALNGVGARIGPDLGTVADRGFTPATLAATMWNHAPAMWAEGRLRNIPRAVLDEQQAADLFAFFYSLRFFEEPGDAARGKALFSSRRCVVCHAAAEPRLSVARPVTEWSAAADPLELVETMWNHSSAMRAEMERNGIRVPQLTGQELADLLIYARSSSGQLRPQGPVFRSAPDQGSALFESKGCGSCHANLTQFLSVGLRDETLTDIAADMWNHGRDMRIRDITFAPGEMRQIANFIWSSRAIEGRGESGAGARVFTAKNCAVCHNNPQSGAPSLTGLAANGRFFSGVTMVSALTRHGPAMLDRMQTLHLQWPKFTAEEMSGLIAYLNTRTARDGR